MYTLLNVTKILPNIIFFEDTKLTGAEALVEMLLSYGIENGGSHHDHIRRQDIRDGVDQDRAGQTTASLYQGPYFCGATFVCRKTKANNFF